MNMAKQMSTIMTMHGLQVCDQWDLVQFSDSGVSPFSGMQFHYFWSIDANEVSKCALPNSSVMEFMI